MNDIEVLFHIKTVCSAITVDFVTAVVGAEAVEDIVLLPIGVDFVADLPEESKHSIGYVWLAVQAESQVFAAHSFAKAYGA